MKLYLGLADLHERVLNSAGEVLGPVEKIKLLWVS
jgi:hypothetical protein